MDYDDNNSQDQNLHLAGEGSSKVSPVLRPYSLPKFDFDDSLPGHLRFESLVENEVFNGITSQEDNKWIEEYSRGTSAVQFSSSLVESRRKNVWSEATSSESFEMLLKSVGQEEKIVEETIVEELDTCDEPGSLTNAMDPNLKRCDVKDRFVGSKVSPYSEQSHTQFTSQSQETQISGRELDLAVIGDHSLVVPEKKVDKIRDAVSQEASTLVNASFNNELQEDPSVSKVECAKAGSSQNVDASIENPQEVPVRCIENASGFSKNFCSSEADRIIKSNEMDNLTDSDTIVETCTYSTEKPSLVSNVESLDKPSVEVSISVDSQKNVESSLPAEGSKTNMAVLTDAVAAVESSKISSPDTPDGVHVPSRSVATADVVTEDQPKSPILGVNSLRDDNEEKAEAGFYSEGSSQKGIPKVESVVDSASDGPLSVVEKGTVSDLAGNVVYGMAGHCVPPVETCNASASEQAAEDNPGGLGCSKTLETSPLPCDSSSQQGNSAESGLLDRKGSMTGQHRLVPKNLAVNKMSDKQHDSVDIAGPCESDAKRIAQDGGGSASMDKPQIPSLSDTNSIELSQRSKDKHKAEKGSIINDVTGEVQSASSNRGTKEQKSFTFEVSASAGIQDLSLAKNTKVSSVNPSGTLSDPNKLHEVSLVSPHTPSSAATQAGAKGYSERKPRRKSVGKEATSRRRSGRVDKSPALLTPPATGQIISSEELKPDKNVESSNLKPGGILPIPTSNLPDLNNSTSISQQSFTNDQQVQLRAQILIYGSLTARMPPEEPHMIAAFGQSDDGRRAWEAAWHTYVERVHGHKPQANNNDTPMQSRSVLKDVGNKDSDQGIKIGSAQSKILSPPTTGPSNMSTSSPFISPMIPISSPLWNISTPGDPRSALLDYCQALSPLWMQNFATHLSWLPQSLFSGQRVASSTFSTFSTHFSASPITDAVKLTTIKESSASGISPIPVDHNAGPGVFTTPKKATVSSVQPSSDSKSQKRKKVAASVAVNPASVPCQAQATSVSTPVVHLPCQISFLDQNQTDSGLPTPASITSKTNPGGLLSAISPAKIVTTKENLSKIEESKRQAEDAAMHANTAISHCQGVWSQMEMQKNSGLVSDDEAKLASSAISIAAAASVAKAAAAAAKIASNVAQEARLMAEEVFLSSRPENFDQSSEFDKATSNPIISAAREAARRRIEAASAAAKHAENLDAILKAAELAAEVVSQAGKIVGMGNPLPLRELIEAGPEGYWKTPLLSKQTGCSDKKNLEGTSNSKEIQTSECDLSPQEDSGNLVEDQMVIDDENDKKMAGADKGSGLVKPFGVILEPESELVHTRVLDQNTLGTSKENIIRESCLVEVYKDDDEHKRAWFEANVLSLKDGKAFVCYTDIQSDEGSGQLKEWVPLKIEGTETPKIRIAHPVTTMRSEGTRKRHRTAVTDYAWSTGDHVDVWAQDCWREGVVVETNKNDVTSLTVEFPGDALVVRSWHIRPTLIWKDDKWIEWSSSKGCRSSEGDTPHKKRPKLGSLIVESEKKDKSSKNIDRVVPGRHEESKILPVSAQENSFDLGKHSMDKNMLKTRKTIRNGVPKEGSGVVFGVPKPGKKQKFMDVINVADGSNKKNTPNDSAKLASFLMPRGSKTNFKNDAKEKQVAETKSKAVKTRKPPIPLFRTKDKSKSCKPASRDALLIDKTVKDSIGVDENRSDHQTQMKFGSSSNTGDSMEPPKNGVTSKPVSQSLKKEKIASGKETKEEVKDKSSLETGEPRRSNRKIQPTSRLLEGLQSSLTISKIPAVSHTSQRSHNKVTSKGNANHG